MSNRRNVVTGRNASWVIGYCEHREGDAWVRSPRSDWVYGIINNGTNEPVPKPDGREIRMAPGRLVGEWNRKQA